ncbi:MAG: aconitase family protein [Christensenellales bacterium]
MGEGGGELAKQLVGRTYDIARPQVVCVYLHGAPQPGVGPQDVALAICGAAYACGYAKNWVMEFVGPGVASLPMDFRNGIDVMTTETTCWSSIWITDERTRKYLALHGREEDYKPLAPAPIAYDDGRVEVDLSKVESMIALPMHPSHAMPIRELLANPAEILRHCQERVNAQISGAKIDLVSKVHDGGVWVEQAVIAGRSGGIFDNLCAAADILRGGFIGNCVFSLSVYPDSMPSYQQLMRNGVLGDLTAAGAIVRECFCGPRFGAGDTPANGESSIRHTTRNFPNREGSKPGEGQLSCVALMDARSIAATARNGGCLTPAVDLDVAYREHPAAFDRAVYDKRVFFGFGEAEPETKLVFGPNIRDWPQLPALSEDALMRGTSDITDPVTTTDELIPLGRYPVLPLQSRAAERVCPVPQGSGLCGARQGRARAGDSSALRGRSTPRSPASTQPSVPMLSPIRRRSISARLSLPTSPATAPPASRRPAASACSAAAPIWRANMPPSVTAPTASTGHAASADG